MYLVNQQTLNNKWPIDWKRQPAFLKGKIQWQGTASNQRHVNWFFCAEIRWKPQRDQYVFWSQENYFKKNDRKRGMAIVRSSTFWSASSTKTPSDVFQTRTRRQQQKHLIVSAGEQNNIASQDQQEFGLFNKTRDAELKIKMATPIFWCNQPWRTQHTGSDSVLNNCSYTRNMLEHCSKVQCNIIHQWWPNKDMGFFKGIVIQYLFRCSCD